MKIAFQIRCKQPGLAQQAQTNPEANMFHNLFCAETGMLEKPSGHSSDNAGQFATGDSRLQVWFPLASPAQN
jgi:hypothetical protein